MRHGNCKPCCERREPERREQESVRDEGPASSLSAWRVALSGFVISLRLLWYMP